MTLVKGNFIGKLQATTEKVENATPEYIQHLVEPPAVIENEGCKIFQVESVAFHYELKAYVIVAKEVR